MSKLSPDSNPGVAPQSPTRSPVKPLATPDVTEGNDVFKAEGFGINVQAIGKWAAIVAGAVLIVLAIVYFASRPSVGGDNFNIGGNGNTVDKSKNKTIDSPQINTSGPVIWKPNGSAEDAIAAAPVFFPTILKDVVLNASALPPNPSGRLHIDSDQTLQDGATLVAEEIIFKKGVKLLAQHCVIAARRIENANIIAQLPSGEGGSVVLYAKDLIACQVHVTGREGALGTDGASGQAGSAGANGQNASFAWGFHGFPPRYWSRWVPSRAGGNGGNGVRGHDGQGGQAGHSGGQVEVYTTRAKPDLTVDDEGGKGGVGGAGGPGGAGGIGGQGGKGATTAGGTDQGSPSGANGHDGDPGRSGAPGDHGHTGSFHQTPILTAQAFEEQVKQLCSPAGLSTANLR